MQERVIALIDMDCFYCQVEVRLSPSLKGKPVAVVQYNTWKGGGIIAVNYEARDLGVTRFMRGDDAQKHCPALELAAVPEVRGRADLSKYREASREVMAILCEFCPCVEKASIDEAYLDLTDCLLSTSDKVEWEGVKNTFVVGYSSDSDGTKQWLKDVFDGGINEVHTRSLAQAALLVEKIRAAILSKTGFHCSAGISNNKILAKLACGLHKPNRQTVLPHSSVPILFENLPLKKIRSLGGKFGDEVNEQLDVKTIGEVNKFSLNELQRKFGEKNGLWLFNVARGIDSEPVKARTVAKSIGCCKNFKGYLALTSKNDVKHWLAELCAEIYERIQDDLITNKRRATLLTVSAQCETESSYSFSRSILLSSYNVDEMMKNCYALLSKFNQASSESSTWEPALKFLGVSASKFVPVIDPSHSLLNFFKRKAVGEADCLASASGVDYSPNTCLLAETVKSSPKAVTENRNVSVFHDSANSFFCSYFSGSLSHIDELTEKNSSATKVANVDLLKQDESTELNPSVPMEQCPDCDRLIAIMDIPEHADYHAARKLHQELNGMFSEKNLVSSNATVTVAANKITRSWTHSSVTRGKNKKLVRTKSDPVAAKNQPITYFFPTKPPYPQ